MQLRRCIIGRHGTIWLTAFLLCFSAAALSQETVSPLEQYVHRDTDLFSSARSTLEVQSGRALDCDRLDVTLYQRAAVLVTPVTLDASVQCEPLNSQSKTRQIQISFKAPRVEKLTGFIWMVSTCHPGPDRCDEVASKSFRVFPDNLLHPLKAWAAVNVLRVYDPAGSIERLLDKSKIEYTDVLSPPVRATSGVQVLTLLYETEDDKQFEKRIETGLQYGDVIAFRTMDDSSDVLLDSLPVITHHRQTNSLTTINLPVAPFLEDSPRAQSLLMELFQLAVN